MEYAGCHRDDHFRSTERQGERLGWQGDARCRDRGIIGVMDM